MTKGKRKGSRVYNPGGARGNAPNKVTDPGKEKVVMHPHSMILFCLKIS